MGNASLLPRERLLYAQVRYPYAGFGRMPMSANQVSQIQTGTDSLTKWIEDGQEVYPCQCGETHRGDYAFYDWSHHTCRHEDGLWVIDNLAYCRACCYAFKL